MKFFLFQAAIVQLDGSSGSFNERLDILCDAWKWGASLVEKSSTDAAYNIIYRLLRHSWALCLTVSNQSDRKVDFYEFFLGQLE